MPSSVPELVIFVREHGMQIFVATPTRQVAMVTKIGPKLDYGLNIHKINISQSIFSDTSSLVTPFFWLQNCTSHALMRLKKFWAGKAVKQGIKGSLEMALQALDGYF